MEKLDDYIERLWTDSSVTKKIIFNVDIRHYPTKLILMNGYTVWYENGVMLSLWLFHDKEDFTLELRVELDNNAGLVFDKYEGRIIIV
jgi:hypothetical protein